MRTQRPKVKYFLPSLHGYVPLDDLTCRAPMRLTRSESDPDRSPSIEFGQYFEAITRVISKDDFGLLVDAVARQLQRETSLEELEEIRILSEKHGSDYHPARIEVMIGDGCAEFVMNVAVTERGWARLSREFEVLQHLNAKYTFPFLPATHFQAEAFSSSVLMFLADWFHGYHEFHLSIDKTDGSQGMVLWDPERDDCRLSNLQMRQVYHQCAKILTLYYDLETFEQIFPWHHAAGDFVVKVQGGRIDVRLITARQYAAMLEASEGVSSAEALFFFLLNLSLRMRLDRLDGVGSVAWADERCADATLQGFVAALEAEEEQRIVGAGFVDGFLSYLRSLAIEDLSDGFRALIDASDQGAPDIPIIRDHLQSHIRHFYRALQSLKNS